MELEPNNRSLEKGDNSNSSYAWSSEKIFESIINEEECSGNNGIELAFSKLIDNIAANYEKYGDIAHLSGKDLPSKHAVIEILEDILSVLFPGYLVNVGINKFNMRQVLKKNLKSIHFRLVDELNKCLKYVCRRAKKCPEDVCLRRAQVVAKEVLEKIPEIRVILRGDIQSAYDGDPAAKSIDEVILSYPCVLAITTYRIAHELYIRGIPLMPRIMSEYAHSKTGIDIHPGARIGKNFFIDHGTGVVIGETAEIGNNVKIYQSVTLGALSFPKDENGRIIKGRKRHPTVGNNVVIYSGATILGGKTILGDYSVICGNAWVTSSIPSGTQIKIVVPELRYTDKRILHNYKLKKRVK